MTAAPENRLKNSASPYLRSAAHQPIDWNEWGEEAFAKARAEGKPVLLDIGAVWCHWCHVIDRESYENPEIAAMINNLYIPVKVDRDERPDVDARYQSAVSAISGQGGWPLTGVSDAGRKTVFRRHVFPARRRRRPSRFQTHPARDFRSVQSAPRGSGQLRERARRSRRQGRSLSRRARRVRCARDRLGRSIRRTSNSTQRTAASATRRNFRTPARWICCSSATRPRATRSCCTSPSARSKAWPSAASTTRWAADSTATRWTSAGACRISRR